MTESIIAYQPMSRTFAAILLGILGSVALGYLLADYVFPIVVIDWLVILTVFVGLPVLVTALGFGVGWHGKKNAIQYSEPQWNYEAVQYPIEEAMQVVKENNRKYWRMVANSNYWIFFIPIALILFMAALPVYLVLESPNLAPYDTWMFAISLALSYTVASFGALRASSNSASDDFTILLVREVVKLAKYQENIPGLSNVRVVFDKAEHEGFTVYEAPRVVSRIQGIEREGYIESWTEELGSVNRVLARIYKSEDHPEVVWWWFSEDRHFRKFVDEDRNGYYVQFPISYKSGEPGVKDVRQVIESAVAIVLREFIHRQGENSEFSQILERLNANEIQPESE